MHYYVYLVRSLKNPKRTYIGHTDNFQERLQTHNSGGSIYTVLDRPWEPILVLRFKDKLKATAFEKYLKSASGNAFAKKRFW
jgi:predicted GIY-YIG superfamily endonuclease